MKQLMEDWRRFIEEASPTEVVDEGALKNLALGAAMAGQLATATPAFAGDTPQEPAAATQQVKQPSLNLKGSTFEKLFNAMRNGSTKARIDFSSKGRYGFFGGQLDLYAKTPEASLKKLDLNVIKSMAEKHGNTITGEYAQALLNDLGIKFDSPVRTSFNEEGGSENLEADAVKAAEWMSSLPPEEAQELVGLLKVYNEKGEEWDGLPDLLKKIPHDLDLSEAVVISPEVKRMLLILTMGGILFAGAEAFVGLAGQAIDQASSSVEKSIAPSAQLADIPTPDE